jgi:putative component of membrane protein insertase Oxa1/YidC/SpoIIIJ protein YidD
MKIGFLYVICLLFITGKLNAQISQFDSNLLKNKPQEYHTYHTKKIRKYTSLYNTKHHNIFNKLNPINLTFSGLLFFYQNVISSQINAGCLYSPSCSEFSKKCIRKYGLIKGVFLTADRLHRCNRITALDIKENIINNRLNDPADSYKITHD